MQFVYVRIDSKPNLHTTEQFLLQGMSIQCWTFAHTQRQNKQQKKKKNEEESM